MSVEDANLGATVLHDADLAGVDTHGIVNLATHMHYAVGLRNGEVEPRPTVTTLRDLRRLPRHGTPVRGFGPVVAHRAMTEASIAKAERTGVGMITVRDGRHFGANGYFVEMAAEMGMVGMVLANTPAAAFPRRSRRSGRDEPVRLCRAGRDRSAACARHSAHRRVGLRRC